MTVHEAVLQARARLERAGLEPGDAAFDADLLARHALGLGDRSQLILHRHLPPPPGFAAAYEALVARREQREPAAYITGVREFWGLEIRVAPGVLVPRPETELLVEEVLSRSPAPGPRSLFVADIGTGSGCLAVVLARCLPHVRVIASDVSGKALEIARHNVERHGAGERVTLVRADLLSARIPTSACHEASRQQAWRSRESQVPAVLDVIVSNPPYVPTGEIASLQPEVRDFEPTGALDGGPDGLDVIRRLVPASASRLTPGGLLVFEFGCGQEAGVRDTVESDTRLELLTIRPDYAGIPRVAVARRVGRG
ncbi:MAG: peptide chain release factor N(5)-glutamine methyltransferase [Acidobacteriota bacterium]